MSNRKFPHKDSEAYKQLQSLVADGQVDEVVDADRGGALGLTLDDGGQVNQCVGFIGIDLARLPGVVTALFTGVTVFKGMFDHLELGDQPDDVVRILGIHFQVTELLGGVDPSLNLRWSSPAPNRSMHTI